MAINLFTVYSYGGGEAIFYVFNAISMLFRSQLISSLINLSLAIGLMFAGIKSGLERDHHRPYVKWLMTYVFIITALIPVNGGMTIRIRDTITGLAKKVDNLPPGLVIPATFISNIGYSLTKNFEAVFSLPQGNYLKYHEYGTMFGAEVMSELENFKIQNPVLRENLESYVNNCIMYDVMIGHSYDIADLKASPDILKLITDNASNIRMFNYRSPKDRGRQLKTCKEGIGELSTALGLEDDLLSRKFPVISNVADKQSNLSQNSGQQSTGVKAGILNALSVALNSYGVTQTGESQIKQLLLINAFKLHPNSYGTVRAAQSQNATWKMTGEMAKQTLPIIHALFQALIYGAFPIVICMMFFPGGLKGLLSYFGMMIWIELWAPLFAILNLITSVFAARSGISDITINNLDSIVSSQSNYALAAASLGMLIPVLSYMIVKGGAGQFVHIAGSLTGASTQSANAAAQEVISGSRSFDNIWSGNKTKDVVSANKFDTSTYIDASGHVKEKLSDGAYQTDLPGKTIYQSGDGITSSVGQTSVSQSGSTRDTEQKTYQDLMTSSQALSKEYASTTQSFNRRTVDYLRTLAEGQSKGKQYSIDTSTEEGKSLTATLGKIHELHEKYDYSWQQATELALGAKANIGIDIGEAKPKGSKSGLSGGFDLALGGFKVNAGFNAGFDVGLSATATATAQDTQNVGESRSASDSKQVADHQALVKKWTESVHYSKTDTEEKRLADGISHTWEVAKSQRESLQISNAKLEQFQQSSGRSEESGLHYTASDYDGLLHYTANRPDPLIPSVKMGFKKARHLIEAHGTDFAKYWSDYKNSVYAQTPNNIGSLLKAKEAILSTKTNFDVGQKIADLTPVDTTGQFKKDHKTQHFKGHDAGGADVQNEVETRQAQTAQAINYETANIKTEKARLRRDIDIADDTKSLIGKMVGRKNQNVESHPGQDDDSEIVGTIASTAASILLRSRVKLPVAGKIGTKIPKLLPGSKK